MIRSRVDSGEVVRRSASTEELRKSRILMNSGEVVRRSASRKSRILMNSGEVGLALGLARGALMNRSVVRGSASIEDLLKSRSPGDTGEGVRCSASTGEASMIRVPENLGGVGLPRGRTS